MVFFFCELTKVWSQFFSSSEATFDHNKISKLNNKLQLKHHFLSEERKFLGRVKYAGLLNNSKFSTFMVPIIQFDFPTNCRRNIDFNFLLGVIIVPLNFENKTWAKFYGEDKLHRGRGSWKLQIHLIKFNMRISLWCRTRELGSTMRPSMVACVTMGL